MCPLQTVSKYVKSLEDDLGIQLFDRTTRRVSLSETGAAYLELCRDLIEQFDEVEATVRAVHTAPKGRIRISAPTAFGELHLVQALAGFQMQYPEIAIDLDLSNRRVSLVEEGFDLVIRIGQLTDSSMIAKKLTNIRVVVCASPYYLENHGTPKHPEELIKHNCLVDNNIRAGRHWPFKVGGKELKIDISGNFQANSPSAIRRMVTHGVGIGFCPIYVLHEDIKTGRVVTLFEQMEALNFGVYAIYPHRKNLSARVRTLVDYLHQQLHDLRVGEGPEAAS